MQLDLARQLPHVLWIGGSPGAGKSTVSHTMARVYVFIDYHLDAWSANHFARRIASGDKEAEAFSRMSMDERWVTRSVEALVNEAITSWTRDFNLVIEDLLALPKDNFIIAEGNFFPECVAPYLNSPYQAIWLAPTDDFAERARRHKQAELAARQKRHGVYNAGSNPEKRISNLIERDRHLAAYVRNQAKKLDLTVLEVDGTLSSEDMLDRVETHFDPYLIECFRRLRNASVKEKE